MKKNIYFLLKGSLTIIVLVLLFYNTGLPQRLKTKTLAKKCRKKCVIYDRPPRTGSTTISKILYSCLISKGYKGYDYVPKERRDIAIHQFLAKTDSDLRALIRPHIHIDLQDHKLMLENCDCIFYITSTAPMGDRIFSRLKYNLIEGHRNGSFTISRLMKSFRKKNSTSIQITELEYTKYPYLKNEVPEYLRLTPHFVIRKNNISNDLKLLLSALECNKMSIISENVHSINMSKRNAVIDKKVNFLRTEVSSMLMTKDFRYNALVRNIHDRNLEGLHRAKYF